MCSAGSCAACYVQHYGLLPHTDIYIIAKYCFIITKRALTYGLKPDVYAVCSIHQVSLALSRLPDVLESYYYRKKVWTPAAIRAFRIEAMR